MRGLSFCWEQVCKSSRARVGTECQDGMLEGRADESRGRAAKGCWEGRFVFVTQLVEEPDSGFEESHRLCSRLEMRRSAISVTWWLVDEEGLRTGSPQLRPE